MLIESQLGATILNLPLYKIKDAIIVTIIGIAPNVKERASKEGAHK